MYEFKETYDQKMLKIKTWANFKRWGNLKDRKILQMLKKKKQNLSSSNSRSVSLKSEIDLKFWWESLWQQLNENLKITNLNS